MSAGCNKAPPTLKSATVNQATPVNSIMVGGQSRQFLTRWPTNYDNKKMRAHALTARACCRFESCRESARAAPAPSGSAQYGGLRRRSRAE